MKKQHQKGLSAKISKEISAGFAGIETLLFVVIIAILAFVGWYVWHSTRITEKTLSSTQAETPTTVTVKKPASTVAYLDIKELGIKFPVPESIRDLAYTWDGADANLKSQSLDDYYQKTDSTCVDGGSSVSVLIGSINKQIPTDNDHGRAQVAVSGTTYDYFGPQQGCSLDDSGGQAANDHMAAIQDNLVSAFQKAQSD